MNIGFIGAGNMASAIIGGITKANIEYKSITVFDTSMCALETLKNKFDVTVAKSNIEVAQAVDVLFLCVKPNIIEFVAEEIRDYIKANSLIVSIAAGKTICHLEKYFGEDKKIVRVMPNTPALVGEAMSALCYNCNAETSYISAVEIMNSVGKCEVVSEFLFDAVTAVSGSSPAYVYMFIEAMADGAVKGGMSRELAYKFAAQAVYGSAKMLIETGKHPGELKDMVCSPGGTTIDAVATLEKTGFRSSVMEAMKACINKSKKMSE